MITLSFADVLHMSLAEKLNMYFIYHRGIPARSLTVVYFLPRQRDLTRQFQVKRSPLKIAV